MITKSILYGLQFLAIVMLLGAAGVAKSIEEPQYRVLESIDEIEIRRYQATVQAVTRLPGKSNSSEGFRRHASEYIEKQV